MKKYSILFLLFLTACGGSYDPQMYATATQGPSAVPTWTQEPTIQPTPTIGYEATAIIAQQTAEAAMRLNVAVTAEAEQRIHQEMAWTAEADARQQEVLGWTATAASTSVGLTATQQAVLNTQIPAQQALMAGQLTSTVEAPTLMVAMRNAQTDVDYWWVKPLGIIFMVFCGGVFLLACARALWLDDDRKRERQRMVDQQNAMEGLGAEEEAHVIVPIDLPMQTIVELRKDNGGGYSSTSRMVVPCTPSQLTELAEGLISGQKTMGFKHWEGKGSLGRETYSQIRNFMQSNRFAANNGKGVYALTADGEAFLRGWLNSSSLPHDYEFGTEERDLQGETSHDRENHDRDLPVGEVKTPDLRLTPMPRLAQPVEQMRRLI